MNRPYGTAGEIPLSAPASGLVTTAQKEATAIRHYGEYPYDGVRRQVNGSPSPVSLPLPSRERKTYRYRPGTLVTEWTWHIGNR
jgi:hypothetical protein